MSSRRAVVVMAKEPVPGKTKTRLHPVLSPEAAADLYRCFLADTIALASGVADAEVILAIDPPQSDPFFARFAPTLPRVIQHGDTLGHRLDAVISKCLDQGYQHVVAIGSDSPTLRPAAISEAFGRLDESATDAVFGPTDDGGYYLIGVKERPARLVTDVEMSTPNVLHDTLAIATELGLGIALLDRWYDIDGPDDLARLWAELADSPAAAPETARFLQRLTPHGDPPEAARHG